MADLTTLKILKDALGEKNDGDDIRLARILTAASAYVEAYCYRVFGSATYTNEMYDGTGTDTLWLRNFPIISVSSLKEYGATLTTGTDPSAGPDALIYAEDGRLVRPFGTFLRYRLYYSVTYVAGYATVPAAIVQACIDVAALMAKEKDHVGLQTGQVNQASVQYTRSLPEASQRTLDLYRNFSSGRAA